MKFFCDAGHTSLTNIKHHQPDLEQSARKVEEMPAT
jgi:hypothetical protein